MVKEMLSRPHRLTYLCKEPIQFTSAKIQNSGLRDMR